MPAMEEGDAKGRAQYEKLRHLLRHDCAGVEKVIRSLNHLRRTHPGNKRIAEVLGYLRNNRHRMGYAEAKAQNLPIGSGGGGGGVQDAGHPTAEAFGDALASRRGASHPDASCAHSKWTFRLGMGVVVRDLPARSQHSRQRGAVSLSTGRLMDQFRTYTRLFWEPVLGRARIQPQSEADPRSREGDPSPLPGGSPGVRGNAQPLSLERVRNASPS